MNDILKTLHTARGPLGAFGTPRILAGALLVAILFGGALARVEFVQRTAPRVAADLDFDAWYYYVSGAEALLEGRGFDWAYHHRTPAPPYSAVPPIQSLILAAIFWMRGDYDLVFACYVQIVINLVAGLVFLDLARRWVRIAPALFFFTGWAFYPEFIRWTSALLTENNYLLFLAATLWLTVRWAERSTPRRAALAAALLGGTNLLRAAGLLMSVFVAALAALTTRGRQRWIQPALIILIPYAVMSPWLVRNLRYNGDAVWTSCNGGLLLQMGNNINADAARWPDIAFIPNETWKIPEIEQRFNSPEFSGERHTWFRYSKLYMPVVEHYMLHHPFHFLRNYAIRGWQQFTLLPTTFKIVYPKMGQFASRLIFYALLIFGLAGVIATPRAWRDPTHRALAACFFYFITFGALMPGMFSGRYAFPLRIFLLLFAARLMRLVLDGVSRRKGKRAHLDRGCSTKP